MGGYDYAGELLAQNPDISAATLLNLLKSKGCSLEAPIEDEDEEEEQSEADTASSNTQALAAGIKKESKPIHFLATRLLEAKSAREDGIGPTKFKTVLIEEGLGNLRDAFYYTREALQSAITVFEGKKIYADHPSSFEEQSRPERSVKDVLGYFENVTLEEDDAGRAMLTADVQLLDDMQYAWARGLMRHAVEYSKKFPDKDFVGLSINASGDAEEQSLESFVQAGDVPSSALLKLAEAKTEGIDTIRVVSKINNAVSCDLVTEAGAGGKVLQMIEQEKSMAKKQEHMKQADEKPAKKPAAAASDAQPSDADQDKALMAKLSSKMGKEQMDEGDEAMAKEALEMAKSNGLEGDEALKCAEYGMKMLKHTAAKAKAKEAEAETKEDGGSSPSEESPMEAVEAKKEEECTKESAAYEALRQKLITLTGENAKLKESLGKVELEKYLDDKCAKSGLPMSVTKGFRESLGTVKSAKDIDRAFDVFKKGYEARSEAHDFSSLILGTEKTVVRESGEVSDSGLNLSDLVR